MQDLGAQPQGIFCITDPATVGLLCNTDLSYLAWKICDADICKTRNVSIGKVCNTNAGKFWDGGTFHCNTLGHRTKPRLSGSAVEVFGLWYTKYSIGQKLARKCITRSGVTISNDTIEYGNL